MCAVLTLWPYYIVQILAQGGMLVLVEFKERVRSCCGSFADRGAHCCWDSHSGRKEWTTIICPLTSTFELWHAYSCYVSKHNNFFQRMSKLGGHCARVPTASNQAHTSGLSKVGPIFHWGLFDLCSDYFLLLPQNPKFLSPNYSPASPLFVSYMSL